MQTSFKPSQFLTALSRLSTMELLAYRDDLKGMELTVEPPRKALDGEVVLIGANTVRLLTLVNTESTTTERTYMMKGVAETAIDHHIAVNVILKGRGFTDAIDTPELTIDLR